jgi:cell division protein FtsW (lipid II flippase)
MSNKWFPKIEDKDIANAMSKQGSYASLVYIGMLILGSALAYFAGMSASDRTLLKEDDIFWQMVGTLVAIPIFLIMAYRIYKGKGWFVSIVFFILFVLEIVAKVIGGTTNVGWIIMYVAVLGMFINGFRGCWYLRSADVSDEGSDA